MNVCIAICSLVSGVNKSTVDYRNFEVPFVSSKEDRAMRTQFLGNLVSPFAFRSFHLFLIKRVNFQTLFL